MSTKEDLILDKLSGLSDGINKVFDKVDDLGEKVVEAKVAIAGLTPRIETLESRQESDRRDLKNLQSYNHKMKEAIETKIESSVKSGFQHIEDKVDHLERDIIGTKKKIDEFKNINDKFDNWQKNQDRDKFIEKVIRAIVAAVAICVTYVTVKWPSIIRVMGG